MRNWPKCPWTSLLTGRTVVERNPSSGQNFEQCILLFILPGTRNSLRFDCIATHGMWSVAWLDG